MPHIKEVLSSEVHWQLAGWNVRDQANARIKMLLGNDAALFAPVYVTHGGYYWSTPDTAGWRLLSDADEATAAAVRRRIEALRASVEARFPAQAEKIRLIFTVPNDDFIFFKSNGTAVPEILISGWGFANFNRARGGQPIRDVEENTLREVTLSFNIDGERQPERSFEFLKPTGWVAAATNAEGIYSFGMQNPGETISVRDDLTGIEQNLLIGPDTRHFDVDVTEYLTLRVNGTCDGNPIEGERAVFHYGHRAGEAVLEQGRADFRLPWLRDCECTVKLRDQEQTRVLDKDSVNVFNFEFLTPQPTRTRVEVYVSANGQPIANEPVRITHESTVRDLMTDANGLAVTEFEIAPGTMVFNPVSALVRDASASEQLAFEPVRFNFDFSTPPEVIFEGEVLAVNSVGDPMPYYPLTIDCGDGSLSYLTDREGRVHLPGLVSGRTMTVADGQNPAISEVYTLDFTQRQYIFRLPYEPADDKGDVTLRVIELSGNPAADVTCILSQNGKRLAATLDSLGEMHFGSEYFENEKDIEVDLYTPRRTFPHLKFAFNTEEKEYELREVDGPTPWWKVAGEVALALGGIFLLFGFYHFTKSFLVSMPYIFG